MRTNFINIRALFRSIDIFQPIYHITLAISGQLPCYQIIEKSDVFTDYSTISGYVPNFERVCEK